MPIYTDIPTKYQWKRDLGLSANGKSQVPALERLIKLVEVCSILITSRGVLEETDPEKVRRLKFFNLIYRQCEFILNNNAKGKIYAKQKMGGELNATQLGAVRALSTFVSRGLMDFLRCMEPNLNTALTAMFGRSVSEHCMMEDNNFMANPDMGMEYYTSDLERQLYKLSFRNGLAHRWSYQGNGKGDLVPYDTDRFEREDKLEFGAGLYAMDQRGHIYTKAQTADTTLKHSSFLGGQNVQCAGTMRVVRGRIVWVSARSGHYRPRVEHMIALLERLSAYQVDLDKVTVYRENCTRDWPKSPCLDFEPCPAVRLLRHRRWPEGPMPDEMKVPRVA